ncbi:OprD family outer membrane porin [Parendozoicomonas haliclonae]|uniref:Outer membrane porin, OprD family n=1 Tax=Parendozoicomonas haliclonae TaxID=1960125 RepID=A0A1X7ARW9_9GAMM|nr:OprD family outer membrane porin [Parendozoicomonas haliclonae]SMA50848.1 outer membrane porin, OprD family [Parendozoicomonas haliclonae]
MRIQKTLIALAVGATFASQAALASPFAPQAKNDLDLINWDTGSSFVDDATMDIKFRSVTYDRDSYRDPSFKEGVPFAERMDSAVAVWADFQSGWLWDSIGFDLGVQGAYALANDGDFRTTQLWANNDTRNASQVGIANIKFRGGDKEAGYNGRVGRMMLNMPFAKSRNTHAMPETFQGAQVNGHYKMVSGYVAQIDGHSTHKTSGMNKTSNFYNTLKTPNGADFQLDFAGLTLGQKGKTPTVSFHYGNQKDYLKKMAVAVEAGMPMGKGNFVSAQAVYQKQEGDKYYVQGDDHKAEMFALNLMVKVGKNLLIKGGYSQVGDEHYDIRFSDNIKSGLNNTTQGWSDFSHANMKAVSIGGSYTLTEFGLPELSLIAQGAYGWDADLMPRKVGGFNALTRDYAWEGAAGITYEVFNGPLQGLWLTTSFQRDGGGYTHTQGGRIILDYTVKLF